MNFVSRMAKRLLGALLSRGASFEIPLDDALMARLSVVDTVAAKAATEKDLRAERVFSRITTEPPVTVASGANEQLEAARPFMERCPCHLTQPEIGLVWAWTGNRTAPGRAGEWLSTLPARSNFTDHELNQVRRMDELYLCLPFLCPATADQEWHFCADRHHRNAVHLPYRGAAKFEALQYPAHPQVCPQAVSPEKGGYGQDALGMWASPSLTYKNVFQANDVHCIYCNPAHLYGFPPEFWYAPLAPSRLAAPGLSWVYAAVYARRAWNRLGRPQVYQLTAWDSAYCPIEWLTTFSIPTIVLVMSVADAQAVEARGFAAVAVTALVGGGRSLANLRLWVAAAMPVLTVAVVTNAFMREPWVIDVTRPMAAPVECRGLTVKNGNLGYALVVAGTIRLAQVAPPSRMANFGALYGLEEACLMKATVPVIRVDHFFHKATVTLDYPPGYIRDQVAVFRASTKEEFAIATGVQRNHTLTLLHLVRGWARRQHRSISWTAARSLPLGVWADPGPTVITSTPGAPTVSPGLPTSISAAIGVDVGVVNWFVFGSRGDVVPVMALARRLRGWGVEVNVVRVHSEAEGDEMLRLVETGNVFKAAPLFIQAMSAASSAPGVVFGPPEFTASHLGVNLRPPPSIVHPSDFGAGGLVNFLLESVLRGWAPTVNVGAYRGIGWLPRSADGETFLEGYSGGTRDIDIMLAWGSSSLPKPDIEGAVEVQPGDHVAQFRRAKVVVCHGGAGTVQTAAACGARVIAGTSILDRRYRQPLDAGRGVQVGADPDAVMLTLLPFSSKVWLWAWKHSWAMWFRAIRWGAVWVFGPAMWLVFALLVKSFVFVLKIPHIRLVFTVSLASSVMASVLAPVLGTWWAVLLAPQLENLITYALQHTGLTYTSLILNTANLLAAASMSPITWALVLAGKGWIAVPIQATLSMFQVGPLLFTEAAALLFRKSAAPPEGGYAQIGISWAWPGSNIPAFHTRFVSADGSRTVEGRWISGYRGLGALYQLREGPNEDANPSEWRFQTGIPWASVATVRHITAPYSPLWNCQSSMLLAARGMWALMGVGLIVMFPMGLWMIICATLATIGIALLTVLVEIVPVVTLVLVAAGAGHTVPVAKHWVYHLFDTLVAHPDDWFMTTLSVLVGLSTGWGGVAGPNKVGDDSAIVALMNARNPAECAAAIALVPETSNVLYALYSAKIRAYESGC